MFIKSGSVCFTVQFCSWLGQENRPAQRLTGPEYFLGGFYTGLCVSFVETPIDLVSSLVCKYGFLALRSSS